MDVELFFISFSKTEKRMIIDSQSLNILFIFTRLFFMYKSGKPTIPELSKTCF